MKNVNEKRQAKLVEKEKENERIRLHKEMIARNDESLKIEKVAPSDCFISLKNINKIYPNHVQAVYDFNLDIKEHEFIVFVGPSGCGKSTTLRMIAGLEDITYGDLFIDGKYSNYIPGRDRDIAMVFQSYALYPHLNVYENMAFSLKLHHIDKEEIDKRIKEAAEILEISDYMNRRPAALSGGQMQRVALGRAIVRKSKLFLMDEPLSNLDAKLRVSMRSEIIKLHNKLNATTIYVTHDQTEAMTMASRIVIMNKGYIQQIGTPQEIYNNPVNTFVATFIGSPSMNLFKVNVNGNKVNISNDVSFTYNANLSDICKKYYEDELINLKNKLNDVEQNFTPRNALISELNELKNKETLTAKDEKSVEKISAQIDILNKANVERNNLINTIKAYEEYLQDGKSFCSLLGVRADDIALYNESLEGYSGPMKATVDLAELLGNQYLIHAYIGEQKINLVVPCDNTYSPLQEIQICFKLNKLHIFDKYSEKSIMIK